MRLGPAVFLGLLAGAIAAAFPAAADPDVFGTYDFIADDGEQATWTLAPCAGNPPGCVRVSETGNSKRIPWSGEAHFSVGSWILFVEQPDAILCEGAAPVPGMNTYSWDAVALSGSASIVSPGSCGAESASLSIPFKIDRIGDAPPLPPGGPNSAAPSVPTPAGAAAPEEPIPAPAGPLAAESSAG